MESTFPFNAISVQQTASKAPINLNLDSKNLFLQYHRGDGIPGINQFNYCSTVSISACSYYSYLFLCSVFLELKDWTKKHTAALHFSGHSRTSVDSCLTVGSTDALSKCLQLLKGDSFICDQYAYGAATSTAEAYGRTCLGVESDIEGSLLLFNRNKPYSP